MRNFLKLLAVALVGFAIWELVRRFWLEPEQALRPLPAPMGPVHGAAMTAGGTGAVQRTLGADGSTTSERVGRGVVKRSKAAAK
jgi:hypothetical protein